MQPIIALSSISLNETGRHRTQDQPGLGHRGTRPSPLLLHSARRFSFSWSHGICPASPKKMLLASVGYKRCSLREEEEEDAKKTCEFPKSRLCQCQGQDIVGSYIFPLRKVLSSMIRPLALHVVRRDCTSSWERIQRHEMEDKNLIGKLRATYCKIICTSRVFQY